MSIKYLLKNFKLPKKVAYETLTEDTSKGTFEIYPFERGMGQSIGNVLRRALLSSLQEYAVSAVRIAVYKGEGHSYVSSEFDNIEGIEEDTVFIIDAIKRLRFKYHDEAVLQDTLRAEFKGKGTFTASPFGKTGVEILNAEDSLFTATDNIDMHIELDVQLGRGYLPSEITGENILMPGTIALDVLFSPVHTVALTVESMRIGYRNDYEKIILQIHTNGLLLPSDALAQAAKILKDHFSVLINFDEERLEQSTDDNQEILEMRKLLELSIDELELSSRSSNCLRVANIRTIMDLVVMSERDIATLPNFGAKSMDEIKQKLQDMNLTLGMPIPEELDTVE